MLTQVNTYSYPHGVIKIYPNDMVIKAKGTMSKRDLYSYTCDIFDYPYWMDYDIPLHASCRYNFRANGGWRVWLNDYEFPPEFTAPPCETNE